MAVAISLIKRNLAGRPKKASCTLTFSGTYPTGGEVVDFAAILGIGSRQPDTIDINGKAGFIYSYDGANKKVMVFTNSAGGANAALTEHTNIGYVGGVSGDTVIADAAWNGLT